VTAAVGYIRVSSKGQDHAMQRRAIEQAAAARGDAIGEWYAEKRTATTLDRPELARLLADVRARKVRRLYVFRLDRLTRTGIADTLALVQELRGLEVELVNLADGFTIPPPGASDSAAKVAELILAILAWAAEMELLTRRERIAARRELAAERGEAWGRPSRLTSADRAAIVERATEPGATVRTIAQAVKVPRSTVARVLKAEAEAINRRRREKWDSGTRSSLSRNPPPLGTTWDEPPDGDEPPSSR
jgi:DNA invertase Pin-like site-specific DNA recombinase